MADINYVSENLFKLNKYNFYHICVIKNDNQKEYEYDQTFYKIKNKIKEIKNKYDYIIKATTEKSDMCVDYMNRQALCGILLKFKKENIFTSTNSIFVNCTSYFNELEYDK